MSDSEADRVGSYYNPVVLSDDESNVESNTESYTSLDLGLRLVLKALCADSDDELMQEFDQARGQARKNIYATAMKFILDSDTESEEELEDFDQPSPKRTKRSTKAISMQKLRREDAEKSRIRRKIKKIGRTRAIKRIRKQRTTQQTLFA